MQIFSFSPLTTFIRGTQILTDVIPFLIYIEGITYRFTYTLFLLGLNKVFQSEAKRFLNMLNFNVLNDYLILNESKRIMMKPVFCFIVAIL